MRSTRPQTPPIYYRHRVNPLGISALALRPCLAILTPMFLGNAFKKSRSVEDGARPGYRVAVLMKLAVVMPYKSVLVSVAALVIWGFTSVPAQAQMSRSEVLSRLALIEGPTSGSVVETRRRMGGLVDSMIVNCTDISSAQRAGDVSAALHNELENSGLRDGFMATIENLVRLSALARRYSMRPIACGEPWAAYIVLRQQGESPTAAVAAIESVYSLAGQ